MDYFEWCDLIEETDADRAYVIENVEAFSACFDAYDFGDISDVGEIRGRYQWSRIWCIEDGQYEWRWIPICETCGSARCQTRH